MDDGGMRFTTLNLHLCGDRILCHAAGETISQPSKIVYIQSLLLRRLFSDNDSHSLHNVFASKSTIPRLRCLTEATI